MMLDKSQIKRVLQDHCQEQIRGKNKFLAIDVIAQTLIEHEEEIIKPQLAIYTLQSFLEKLNAKEPKTQFPLFKAMELCRFALKRNK